MIKRTVLPIVFCFATTLVGCGDGQGGPPPPSTSASSLAPSTAAESKTLAKMSIDASGTAMFDMKAPLENIKGTVKGFGGDIDVELSDLTKSRGEITIDITTLETHTFGEDDKDKTQTQHAHTWLEVGEKTAADKKSQFKTAKFAIREVVNVSQADVTKMSGDSRNVTLTAKGDFLLHGRSVSLSLDLSCAFLFEGDKLKGISIKSAKPATVNLKAHAVEARNDAGEAVIAKTLELFGSKVADDASVTFEAMARPRGEKGLMPSPPATATAAATTSAAATATAAPGK
ncbi:MAG: YceI family protein [Polyangiaceae bacterium]|nr:YceI family protein [Polyangiaceae bacterium]